MSNKKGFTLTEVLLGIMIVGIIGIALAALTTSASRDSGHSSSKIMLRNNLSIFMRQLRQDVHDASKVDFVLTGNVTGNTNLLTLRQNTKLDGTAIIGDEPQITIMYCFLKGSIAAAPSGSTTGGTIKRWVGTGSGNCQSNGKVVLNNVKLINSGSDHYPLFQAVGGSLHSILKVQLILEIPSTPVINDVVEDHFMLPNGY